MKEPKSISERVNDVLLDCLFREEEVTNGEPNVPARRINGIVRNFGFHAERLEKNREEVRALLDLMPKEFHPGTGGASFLNLCMDKDGNQWGEHQSMEALVCLALGLGMARYCMPRELWTVLPGGMPYVAFHTKGG